MCDYSLMALPNRLAKEGEELVSIRFEGGTIGLASRIDLQSKPDLKPDPRTSFWQILKEALLPATEQYVTAVCVPPGAQLLLMDIHDDVQDQLGVGRSEKVTFTQMSAELNTYRDAVRFPDGRELLLQRLRPGQRVCVLSLGSEPMANPSESEAFVPF